MNWCAERTRQVSGLLYGGLDPAEVRDVRSHLRYCRPCAESVRTTRSIDDMIDATLAMRVRAAGSPAADRRPAPAFRALADMRRRSLRLQYAAFVPAAAGLLVALVLVWPAEPAIGVARPVMTADLATDSVPERNPARPMPASGTAEVAPALPPPAAEPAARGALSIEDPIHSSAPFFLSGKGTPAADAGPAPDSGRPPAPPARAAAPAPDVPADDVMGSSSRPAPSAGELRRLQAARDAVAAAEQAFERGEWRRAADLLRRTTASVPETEASRILVSARKLEGWCALREGAAAAAQAAFSAALVQCPDDMEAVLGAGLSRVHGGEAAAGVPWLRLAAAVRPEWISVRLGLGWALLAAGAIEESAREFSIAKASRPDTASAAAGSAWCAYRLGDDAAAEAAFAEALGLLDRKAPGESRGAVEDGWLVALEERRMRVQQRYATVAGSGLCAWARGDAPAALRRLESLVFQKPDGPDGSSVADEVFETVAWAKLDSGRASAALKDFRGLAGRRNDVKGRARAESAQGWCQLALGRKAEARSTFEKALDLCPGEPAAVEGLASLDGTAPAGRLPGSARVGGGARPAPGPASGTGSGMGGRPAPHGGMGR